MPRQNQWFVPGEGIAREVITADIQRYLGPDALVRPGEGSGDHEGVPGYWITAYRTLTTQMITDLKLDSQRWRAEAGRVAYRDSKTHESRQYYGPTTAGNTEYPQSQPPPARPAAYSSSGYPYGAPPDQSAYTHAPQQGGYPQSNYQVQYTQPPRTQPAAYPYQPQQSSRESHGYAQAEYAQHYGQPPPETRTPAYPPVHPPTQSAPSPGYYIASDGRQYPISQQPQSNMGRRRN